MNDFAKRNSTAAAYFCGGCGVYQPLGRLICESCDNDLTKNIIKGVFLIPDAEKLQRIYQGDPST